MFAMGLRCIRSHPDSFKIEGRDGHTFSLKSLRLVYDRLTSLKVDLTLLYAGKDCFATVEIGLQWL